jgi:hypothetical protein
MKKFFLILSLALAAVCAIAAPAETANVLGVIATIAIVGFVAANVSRQSRRNALVPALNTLPANIGGTENARRFLATAAIGTRFLFVKQGADAKHIAAVSATSDKPVGICTDEPADAEDPAPVELSGLTNRTITAVAGAAIATLNADMYMTAAGKVVIKPTAAGTYWKVGRNHTLADAANDPVEITLCEPRKLIVLAALTSVAGDIADTNSTAVNPTKADFDSLLVAAGKLQADFHLLVAALKSDADIDFATT